MSDVGLAFGLAPFCGASELFTWHAEAPTGLDIFQMLVAAGYSVRMNTPTLRMLDTHAGGLVTLRPGHPVQVRVAMSTPLEAREGAIRQEEARLNVALGFATDAPEAVAAGLSEDFKAMLEDRISVIQDLYLNENAPLVIGYSGGKDSTAVAQLIWEALRRLPLEQRTKAVHLVSTDTGVENPAVARMADASLEAMQVAAKVQGIPWEAHRLRPTIEDSWWTMVLGRGYAVPRPLFRWCTSRLKIDPANAYVMSHVEKDGGVIQVLGTRKTESAARGRSMARHETGRTRPFLSPNQSLNLVDRRRKDAKDVETKAWIFSPIEDWSTEDVWSYLTEVENPWGYDNSLVAAMYASASDASECPMTLDASQGSNPSCGKSRFGCWTCTLVEEEKSLTSFIVNDPATYGWLQPLLDLRNRLNPREEGNDETWSDAPLRTHYRVQESKYYLFHNFGKTIRGRYIQSYREDILRDLLRAQASIQANGPEWARSFELINLEELEAVRHLWLTLWNEVEDNLPVIYEEVLGVPYPGPTRKPIFRNVRAVVEALRAAALVEGEASSVDPRMLFEQAREILVMEALRAKTPTAERPLSTEEIYHRHQVHSEAEAPELALREQARREAIKRILAQAKAVAMQREPDLSLHHWDVTLYMGGVMEVKTSDVVAATPGEASAIAARSWIAKYSDHAIAWGLSEEEILAGAKATWKSLATKKETPSEVSLKASWWNVHFDRMGHDFSLLVKAQHAREAVVLASAEAAEFADVLAGQLGVDIEMVGLLLADDEESWPVTRETAYKDKQAIPMTLRVRGQEIRAALARLDGRGTSGDVQPLAHGVHPSLFDADPLSKSVDSFLEDWLMEESVG